MSVVNMVSVIDSDGYRANVGIVLVNDDDQVLWARRIGQYAWQFPQGGIVPNETPEAALYRELAEEIGLEEVVAVKMKKKRNLCTFL